MNLYLSLNNLNSFLAKFIIIVSTIVTITPAILPYYYDIPYLLVFIFFISIALQGKFPKIFSFLIFFAVFFISLQLLFNFLGLSSFQGLKRIIVDFRYFSFFFFAILIHQKGIEISKYLVCAFLIIVTINTLYIVFGMINPDLYRSILINYFAEHYSVYSQGRPLTLTAYQGGRIMGLMLAPIFTGIFFITLSYLSYLCFRFLNMSFTIMLIIQILCVTAMFQANTTIKLLFPLIIILSYYFEHKNIFIKLNIFVIGLFVLLLSSLLYFDEVVYFIQYDLLSGRLRADGSIFRVWSRIDLSVIDLLFGFSPEAKGEFGKGFGDMGYNYRMTYGGLIYLVFFYFSIFFIFKKYFNKLFFIWLPIYMMGLAIDLGGSYFSIPHVGWLLIISIVTVLKNIEKLLIKKKII